MFEGPRRPREVDSGRAAAVVVLEALDVVLAGVGAALDLDDHELLARLVAQPVLGALGHVDAVTGPGGDRLAVHDTGGDAEDHDPVLGAVLVGLVRQSAARLHVDALDLVAVVHVDDVPGAPGALLGLECHSASPCRLSGSTPGWFSDRP